MKKENNGSKDEDVLRLGAAMASRGNRMTVAAAVVAQQDQECEVCSLAIVDSDVSPGTPQEGCFGPKMACMRKEDTTEISTRPFAQEKARRLAVY